MIEEVNSNRFQQNMFQLCTSVLRFSFSLFFFFFCSMNTELGERKYFPGKLKFSRENQTSKYLWNCKTILVGESTTLTTGARGSYTAAVSCLERERGERDLK